MDCLVDSGAIPDDNWRIVPDMHIKGRECPKGDERVEVSITFPPQRKYQRIYRE